MKKFDPNMKKNECFFSNECPDIIFRKIADALEENGQTFEINSKKWKLHYMTKRICKPKVLDPIEGMENLDIAEETKDNALDIEEKAEIQVEIMDADLYGQISIAGTSWSNLKDQAMAQDYAEQEWFKTLSEDDLKLVESLKKL